MVLIVAAIVVGTVYALMPKPLVVEVELVQRGPMAVTVDEDGQTRIRERYVVSAPLAGRQMRIGLDVGDPVKVGGTVITRIEPTDPDLLDPRAQAQAQARVNAAKARLDQTQTEMESALASRQNAESVLARAKQLFEATTITRDQLDRAELSFRKSNEDYRSARFSVEIARFELQVAKAALLRTQPSADPAKEDWYFEIRAPIDGRVLKLLQQSETIVTPGVPLVELGDPADLEVVVDVLSMDAVKIRPNARVYLEHWGGEAPLVGRVRLVEPSGFTKVSALGVEEQRVNVIIDFENADDHATLGDGFRVEARIVIWEEEDVLRIPTGALFRDGESWAVFKIAQGKAKLQPVKIGQQNGQFSQILDGLLEEDRVILHPSDQVTDDVEVAAQ